MYMNFPRNGSSTYRLEFYLAVHPCAMLNAKLDHTGAMLERIFTFAWHTGANRFAD